MSISRSIFSVVVLVCLGSTDALATQDHPKDSVRTLILSSHSRDFSAAFPIVLEYQIAMFQIRRSNPEVLWERLARSYFEEERQKYDAKELPWDRQLSTFIPPTAEWTILETQQEGDQARVYASVIHNEPEASPFLEGKEFIKEAIMMFSFRHGFFHDVSRIVEGDVLWEAEALCHLLDSRDENVKEKAARTLVALGDSRGVQVLRRIEAEKREIRIAELLSLIRNGMGSDPTFVNSISGRGMLRELISFTDPRASELLVEVILLGTGSPHWSADDAAGGLTSIGRAALPALEAAMRNEPRYRQIWAQRGWGVSQSEWRMDRVKRIYENLR